MSCCRTCTTCTLREQQYSSRSLVHCAMLNRWTSILRLTVESATTRPGFRSAAKLLSRERSESCLVCALRKSEHACESLRFACSSGDLPWAIIESTSANNDGDGDGREKARTGDGGTFARLCVRGRRKVCRAQLENILDVQRRSNTTFPIRAVHSTCMYSNATSASAQLACNMTVQHVQVCREMRWPRPSHDSWPRSKKGIKLIPKTIGNRKGDYAWSCSRGQTQPEKICKLQSTSQYNVTSAWHWFVRCDLQTFSGCVCHLEKLHAQSPFLFPLVFGINSYVLLQAVVA